MEEFSDDYETKSLDTLERQANDRLELKSFDRIFTGDEFSGFSDVGGVANPRILKSIYQTEDWVYILVDKIASKLAQIPWQVHRQTMKDGELLLEPALNHPVQKMLDEPNPLQPSYAFKYSCITDHSVTGNALIYISQTQKWLVQVPTEIVRPDITGRGDLRGYDIVGIDPMSFPVDMRTKLRPQDVIHVKRPNPSSVYWGMSPLQPGVGSSLFNKYSSEYLLNFYRKGAQPGLVLEMGEEANEMQAKKLLASLETSYTGRANQRRGLVLPKGVIPHNLQPSLADQQLIEYIRNNRETLINIYGVPKHELSIAEAGSLGSEEAKTALKNFWQGPLMAIGTMFETSFTAKLKPMLGPQYLIKLNYSDVPILQDDLMEQASVAQAMLSTMTINEVRQRVWKMPPIDGGDVLSHQAQPFGYSSYDQPDEDEDETPPPPAAPLPPKPPSAPPPKEEEEEPSAVEMKAEPNSREDNVQALSAYAKASKNAWIEESRQRTEEAVKQSSAKMADLWLKLLEDQVVASVKIAKEEMVEKSADVPSKRKLQRKIDEAMDEVESQWRDGYVENLEEQVELGYGSVLEIPFNKPYKDSITAIKDKNKDQRRTVLAERGLESFDQISKTTSEKIMRAIENGMKESRSISEIAEKIKEIANISAGRALTIARTETLIANSIGEAAAMKDAAVVIPKLVKVWINLNDERVRGKPGGLYEHSKADHWGLLGEVVDHNKTFSNGLRYPRDTKGPPEEIINCRCTMLTVSEDDLEQLGLKR